MRKQVYKKLESEKLSISTDNNDLSSILFNNLSYFPILVDVLQVSLAEKIKRRKNNFGEAWTTSVQSSSSTWHVKCIGGHSLSSIHPKQRNKEAFIGLFNIKQAVLCCSITLSHLWKLVLWPKHLHNGIYCL